MTRSRRRERTAGASSLVPPAPTGRGPHNHPVTRRILRLDGETITVAAEATFDSEQTLRDAIAQHPEVLPADDLGLGQLVTLATELPCGAGYMDMLAVDASGRLVIAEFKRGVENPDIRKVVAQLLDYGSALWRNTYDELSDTCRGRGWFKAALVDYVQETLAKTRSRRVRPRLLHPGCGVVPGHGQLRLCLRRT